MQQPPEPAVYAAHPTPPSDEDFEPGSIELLVAGNRGRLLDARRTPIAIGAADVEVGLFEVEVRDFEDSGAIWRVPFEEVNRFQIARGSPRVDARTLEVYAAAVARLDRRLEIEPSPAAAARAWARIDEQSAAVSDELDALGLPSRLDPALSINSRRGDEAITAAVHAILSDRGVAQMDAAFAEQYVSNPWSGELVKGHAVVLAELGLAAYRGKCVRDEGLFDGEWSKARRAEHLIARLATMKALWSRTDSELVTLYRAAATDRPSTERLPSSFVSATFSRRVAEAHFAGGPATTFAVMYRRSISIHRLFLTFWETAALDAQYREAEAVLLRSPDASGF